MSELSLDTLVERTNAGLNNPGQSTIQGDEPQPRFELYHFAFSICSQKVRAVLREKAVGYRSNLLYIGPAGYDNYQPDYVRLRLRGVDAQTPRVGKHFTGRSATGSEGFDPCVVPTLVDRAAQRVIIDSQTICRHIETAADGGCLIPETLREDVLRQVEIVDGTPHVAILYGPHPGEDTRPPFCQEMLANAHDAKIDCLERHMQGVRDAPALVDAYRCKIAKEKAAQRFTRTPQAMQAAIDEVAETVAGLEQALPDAADWLFGDQYTMADTFWGVSLYRLRWLGMAYLWEGDGRPSLPRVATYARRLFTRPALRDAVIDYPGCPPSPHA